MAKDDTPKPTNTAMNVVEISAGTSPYTEEDAQSNPPDGQQPALDPTPLTGKDAENSADAGAMWPREPGGPVAETPTISAMGTTGTKGAPVEAPKVVTGEGQEPPPEEEVEASGEAVEDRTKAQAKAAGEAEKRARGGRRDR